MPSVLQTRIWVIPLAFAALFGGGGWWVYQGLEDMAREQVRAELEALLESHVVALRVWIDLQRAVVEAETHDPLHQSLFGEVVGIAAATPDPARALLASPAHERLARRLASVAERHGYVGFGINNRHGTTLVSSRRDALGRRAPLDPGLFERVLAGETVVTRPGLWPEVDPATGRFSGEPSNVMLILAPIRDPSGEKHGLLGFGFSADRDFSRILTGSRMGGSGETYAFDRDGLMVSESRFNDQLRELGLIGTGEGSRSSMTVQIRDPGGPLLAGHVADVPLLARPLTVMAAAALSEGKGSNSVGYRDYRGVPVVGAWTWLDDLDLGVATEIDVVEAYAGLARLRRYFAGLVGLLVIASLGMLLYSAILARVQSRMERVLRLGRYRIRAKIGEGGMGAVYRASHAMLQRPTAIKLLNAEGSSEEGIARFEREVQTCSELTHPNTIAIYDYGRTPEGVFYYAMEYLEGITVGQLVDTEGPQPEARVVFLMKQACGSIAEAHAKGVIHRDLKPANIMLCERGGIADFVKVLDFGLVRREDQAPDVALTSQQSLTGTPLYLAPEAVEAPDTIDVRADVYQLGAVAYFLLTGRNVFPGDSVVEVIAKHLSEAPVPPSEALGRPVSEGLERIVLRCLSKRRDDRFADAAELLEEFEALLGRGEVEGEWTQRDAHRWWQDWWQRHPAPTKEDLDATSSSTPSGYQVDVSGRLSGSASRH